MPWLQVLKSRFPASQAAQELRWIQQELPKSQWQTAVEQRARLVPLQYILGSQPFGDLTIKCKPGVLIPRNDTEEWCEALKQVIAKSNGPVDVLEYCTGSGCIGLSVATLANVRKVIALDINKQALALSKENLQLNSAKIKAKVEFQYGDLLKHQLPQTSATLLLSNPPYIPREHFSPAGGVEESVLKYEPENALVGNLEFYSALGELVSRGTFEGFVFELGYREQAEHTKSLLPNWTCGIRYDSRRNIRNIIGWKPSWNILQSMCDEIL